MAQMHPWEIKPTPFVSITPSWICYSAFKKGLIIASEWISWISCLSPTLFIPLPWTQKNGGMSRRPTRGLTGTQLTSAMQSPGSGVSTSFFPRKIAQAANGSKCLWSILACQSCRKRLTRNITSFPKRWVYLPLLNAELPVHYDLRGEEIHS